jgi:chemotaxis signal transduction protein
MNKSSPTESFVLFELAGNTCGVRSRDVQVVEWAGPVTPVPNALPYVEGVTLTRGKIIPSINLRTLFGLPAIPVGAQARMVVVRFKVRTVAMLVDSAREFTSIPTDAIQPLGERIAAFSARFVEGIATLGNRSVLVLNLNEVMEGV